MPDARQLALGSGSLGVVEKNSWGREASEGLESHTQSWKRMTQPRLWGPELYRG